MLAARQPRPFNPGDYANSGTYIDLIRGMEEALRRWDEINVLTALVLPAYLREGREAEVRHNVPMFGPSSLENFTRENVDATMASCELIQRAYDDGYDAGALLNALGADMRPRVDAAAVQFKQRQKQQSAGLLRRLFGG